MDCEEISTFKAAPAEKNTKGALQVKPDFLPSKEAFDLYKKAKKGDAEAQFNLSVCYENGISVPQDLKQAFLWYQKAADQGHILALAALGALQLTSSSLDDFYAEAKRSEEGQGKAQDLKKAFTLYEALAKKGYAPALVDSARCLFYGRGTLINKSQAAERVEHALHLKLSKEQDAEALWIQGMLYEAGYVKEGKTIQDKALAERCYQKAWVQGHLLGGFRLGGLYADQKRETEAAQLFEEIVPRLQKRAPEGNSLAQNSLGLCYANGQGVPQDFSQAVFWYQKAAGQGHADAQCNLGVCYANGQGVPQDFKKAAHWFQKAADQGFASAQFNLGWCYANGQGVPQDYSQAVRWYQKAAGQGHAQAQFNLGGCYENGQGVPRNRSQAIHWYQKAADQGDRDAQAALKRLGH
jgi:TPR repeat protein